MLKNVNARRLFKNLINNLSIVNMGNLAFTVIYLYALFRMQVNAVYATFARTAKIFQFLNPII